MSRMMVVFIDGLAFSRFNETDMPFCGKLPSVRVRSQAGFSTTCWGNLWTGVHPDKHNHWFQIVRAPLRSPFGPAAWVPSAVYRKTPALGLMAWQRLLSLRRRNRSVFGYPFMHFVHPHFWRLFDVVEDRTFGEPGFYAPRKYLFEYLNEHRVTTHLLGVHRELKKMQHGTETLRVQLARKPELRSPDLIFMLFGDIDYLSHYTGPESPQTRARLKEIDAFVEQVYEQSGGDRELIVLSDHGHLSIHSKIDLYAYVPELVDRVHQVEDMWVRVWTDNAADAERVTARLRTVPGLRILEDEDLRRHRLPLTRDRHGHVMGILDHHLSFLKTSWTRFNKFLSDHGYLPNHPELDAFFAGTFLGKAEAQGTLVDFLPTLFTQMGLPLDPEFEGRSLLATASSSGTMGHAVAQA
jgi:predicted AlkP superfamily pyrophosphatase or phosphodiesterase